jgi:hypothetical protein
LWPKWTEREILKEAERTDREEDALYGSGDLPEKGEQSPIRASGIEAAAHAPAEDERKRKAARALAKETQNLRKYEAQEEKLAGRNSYSRTDPGTQDGFITGVSVSQNPNDTVGFIARLESGAALAWIALGYNLMRLLGRLNSAPAPPPSQISRQDNPSGWKITPK